MTTFSQYRDKNTAPFNRTGMQVAACIHEHLYGPIEAAIGNGATPEGLTGAVARALTQHIDSKEHALIVGGIAGTYDVCAAAVAALNDAQTSIVRTTHNEVIGLIVTETSTIAASVALDARLGG